MADQKKIYRDRKIIFNEGELGEVAYLVRTGQVALVKKTKKGPVTLATIGKNAIFGEMALLDGSPRMATAIAVGDTICSVVNQTSFDGKLGALKAELRGTFQEMLRYVRTTLPWEHRSKHDDMAIETVNDTSIRPKVPAPDAPPPAGLDPVMLAIYQILISYVRRRLPVQPPS